MPFVKSIDGATLHYTVHDYTDRWRDAGTIILVHGFARSGEFWFNIVPYLARFYRVVCPDLRGLGQSQPLAGLAASISIASRSKGSRSSPENLRSNGRAPVWVTCRRAGRSFRA